MPNIIKQIVKPGEYGSQTIKMIVKSNERGPKGEQGDPGETATIAAGQAYSVNPDQNPAVINTGTSANAVFDFYIPKGEKGDTGATGPAGRDGTDGKDGAIHYTAGQGITISPDNVISSQQAAPVWGVITGDLDDQTDLKNALDAKQDVLTAGDNISIQEVSGVLTISGNYGVATTSANGLMSSADKTKLNSIASGAEVNVQSDWNVSDNSSDAFIKNKPTIPTVNNSTITVTNNGASKGTFTTNQASASTVALDYPVITVTDTDPGEGAPLAANNFVAVY